jgi:hypothetical protein
MLAHQHRGRRHDGDLPPGKDRRRRGAQGHLGLAEADIAADEPVHRHLAGEVGQRLLYRPGLIAGQRIAKTGREALHLALGRHDLRGVGLPTLLRGLQHRPRRLGERRLRLQAPPSPGAAVEPVEGHGFGLRAVAPDPVRLAHGHHEDGIIGKTQAQGVFLVLFASADRLQPLEEAQAVIAVDRHIADPQLDLADRQHGGPSPRTRRQRAEQIGRSDHRRPGLRHVKPRFDRHLDRQHRAGLRRLDLGPAIDQAHGSLVGRGGRPHEAAQRRLGAGKHDALARFQRGAQGFGKGGLGAALADENRSCDPLRLGARRRRKAACLGQFRPFLGREIEIRRGRLLGSVVLPAAGS